MRDWLSQRVASSPDHAALIRAEDGEAWTYTDLDRLVSETAGRLVAHGIEAGDRLGVLTPPYVGTVGLVHATMRIGGTFVPLGQDLTERELAERVERADLDAVVCAEPTEDAALGAVEECGGGGELPVPVFSVDDPAAEAVTAVHGVDPEPVDPPEWADSEYLCILFTSGTTGDPKPVPLTAGNVYSSAVASAFRLGVDQGDRWLVSLSLHHMGGLAPVYRSVLYGTTLVLREGFDPGGTADDIDTYDVTGISLVPTMLRRMLDRRGTLSDTLRVVLLGGAPASDELLERCRDYSIPVYPTYGMTETASQIATATPRQTRDRLGTVGRPLFATDVTLVDGDGSRVDAGESGEIVVDGPTVTPGYIGGVRTESADARDGAGGSDGVGGSAGGEPDAEALDRSAFGPHGLHTGDVGRFDDEGFLYVLNRLDDRIITGGENVEPGEVVDVLREFPPIDDAAVVGLDDDVWGERVSALLAVGDLMRGDTTTGGGETGDEGANDGDAGDDEAGDDGADDAEADGAEADGAEAGDAEAGDAEADDAAVDEPEGDAPLLVDEERLVSFARDRLAGFKIPKTVAYVDELPRTVSGTVDREAVRRILRTRGHDPRSDADLETAGFEPAEPAEPAEPTDSDEPTESADSTESAEPSGSTESTATPAASDDPDERGESDRGDENGDRNRDAVDDGGDGGGDSDGGDGGGDSDGSVTERDESDEAGAVDGTTDPRDDAGDSDEADTGHDDEADDDAVNDRDEK
ncbi:class I adenylate-forming enzyme family protein [Halorubrum lipolyticum]|uniref:AMP-dependent synthetase and ligase n=1 Tax=Halorubrum lipolyticum DSM 21995 TaxID=1227482 RepID=M0P2D9_9EURY|nr:AMP-binding protein [Halorubrum lipolyticum]EMA64322.1 AMP-dependent synthetase and ligase [Halorubrum lipolyticum DSM 21995]